MSTKIVETRICDFCGKEIIGYGVRCDEVSEGRHSNISIEDPDHSTLINPTNPVEGKLYFPVYDLDYCDFNCFINDIKKSFHIKD